VIRDRKLSHRSPFAGEIDRSVCWHAVTALDPADDLAIRRLVHRYADAVVRRDAAAWASCWAERSSWDLGRGRNPDGKEQIVALWRQAMGGMAAVVQMVHNGAADATDEPDRATGRWYIDERYRRADGTDGILLAHYDDEYVREADGEWRFARRALVAHYSGPPDLSADFHNTRATLEATGTAVEV
jgi:ketosteroid isomerase-like protein